MSWLYYAANMIKPPGGRVDARRSIITAQRVADIRSSPAENIVKSLKLVQTISIILGAKAK
jgi:hypothetical protein